MKRRRPFPRIPRLALFAAVVAFGANALVIPGLQAQSSDPLGLAWWVLPVGFSGVAVVSFSFWPWMAARRPRNALRLIRESDTPLLAFLAVVGTSPKEKQVVVTVDSSTLTITGMDNSNQNLSWIETGIPVIIDSTNGSYLSLRSLADNEEVRIYPMEDNGFQFKLPDELEKLHEKFATFAVKSRTRTG